MSEIVYDSKMGNAELTNNLGLTLSSASPRIKHTGTGTLTMNSPSGSITINANGATVINSSDTTNGITIGSTTNVPVVIASGGGTVNVGTSSTVSTFSGDVIITGDLTVTGDTVSQEVTVIQSEDPILHLNEGLTNSDTNTSDIGFVGNRGGANNIGFVWDESADQFICAYFTSDAELSSNTITPSDYANLRCGALTVDDTLSVNGIQYTFPASDGTSGYVLSTNSSGTLSWVANGGSSAVSLSNGVNNRLVTAASSSSLNGESTLTFDGSNLSILVDGTVLSFGADSDVNLTHVADTGLLLNGAMKLHFRDSAIHVSSDADGYMNVQADTGVNININGTDELAITSTTATFGTNIVIPDAGQIGSASDTNAITISSGGVVAITATTASSSSSTGALTVAGGAGIAADLFVGDDLSLISDGAVLNFGADSDVNLTHVADNGLLLNSSMQLQFRDSTNYVNSDAAGYLNLRANTGTTFNINGVDEMVINSVALSISNGLLIPNDGFIGSSGDNNAITISAAGVVALTGTTESTSSSTGTLTVAGGAGIAANVHIGNDLSLVSDSAILNFGADKDVNLTHVADTGLLLNGAMQLQFRDSAIHVSSDADGYMNVQADTGVNININGTDELAITSTTATFGTNIVIPDAGSIGSSSDTNAITISAGGVVAITATTASTSSSTGALTVAGGMGVADDLYVGDHLDMISDGARIYFGADREMNFEHNHNFGMRINIESTQTNGVDGGLQIRHTTSATPSVGIGTSISLSTETADNEANTGTILESVSTDVTLNQEDFDFVVKLMTNGQTAAQKFRVTSAGDSIVANDLSLASDASVLNFGADSDVNLTHVADTGLLLNSNMQLQFRDSAVHISSDADGYMNVQADTGVNININGTDELAITSTTATFGTNIIIPNAGSIGSVSDTNAITISSSGVVAVTNTTASTSNTTGALTVTGGLGVGDDIYLGANLYLDADNTTIFFGADSDVRMSHFPDIGLWLTGDSTTANTVLETLRLRRTTSGTPSAGIGTALSFATETFEGNAETGVIIEAVTTDVTPASEDFDIVFKSMTGGSAATEKLRIASTGVATFAGNIIIPDAGSIGSATDTDAITISADGDVNITSTTASSSVSTGALIVGGGVGIAGDISAGNNILLKTDGSDIFFGVNGDVSLTHVHDTGLLLNSTRQLQFQDSGTYLYSSENGQLDMVADGTMVDAINLSAASGGITLTPSSATTVNKLRGTIAQGTTLTTATSAVPTNESGSIIYIDTSSNTVSAQLPTAAVGLSYTFVLSDITTINGSAIESATNGSTFVGYINDGGTIDTAAAGNDTLTFSATAAAGDWVQVTAITTGIWMVHGSCTAATSAAFTTAS